MNEVDKALAIFLLQQGCPPRICYTCENQVWMWKERKNRGFFVCTIHPEAGAVGDEDYCADWVGLADIRRVSESSREKRRA
uniref:Uncharacterized protein n=1 Tax=viral metagenome TaxID=1070528 RepID=A0A6H1Z7V5_9ZZZZ